MNSTAKADLPTWIFLSGLGADHRLFKYQTAAFSNKSLNPLINLSIPRTSSSG